MNKNHQCLCHSKSGHIEDWNIGTNDTMAMQYGERKRPELR
jgi:hypothetical protein